KTFRTGRLLPQAPGSFPRRHWCCVSSWHKTHRLPARYPWDRSRSSVLCTLCRTRPDNPHCLLSPETVFSVHRLQAPCSGVHPLSQLYFSSSSPPVPFHFPIVKSVCSQITHVRSGMSGKISSTCVLIDL